MVRDVYPRFQMSPRPFTQASLGQLFQFTHQDVTSVSWVLHPDDWANLFETATASPVMARAIDSRLSATLSQLPNLPAGAGPTSLATRNLIRGLMMNLPSGQTVAKLMAKKVSGIQPLRPGEIAAVDPSGFLEKSGLTKRTPLWYYILLESQLREQGARLGAVGGRLVAEVMIGLLQGDPNSYLRIQPQTAPSRAASKRETSASVRDSRALVALGRATAARMAAQSAARGRLALRRAKTPAWAPMLPSAQVGQFTMADLIRFANS